jgi:hypothetical protein
VQHPESSEGGAKAPTRQGHAQWQGAWRQRIERGALGRHRALAGGDQVCTAGARETRGPSVWLGWARVGVPHPDEPDHAVAGSVERAGQRGRAGRATDKPVRVALAVGGGLGAWASRW